MLLSCGSEESRLADSFETALQLSDGLAITENADNSKQKIYSAKFACPVSGFTIEEIEPRLFSFNNPHGACPECDGLGSKVVIDAELVVPDKNLSLKIAKIFIWLEVWATLHQSLWDIHCLVKIKPFV